MRGTQRGWRPFGSLHKTTPDGKLTTKRFSRLGTGRDFATRAGVLRRGASQNTVPGNWAPPLDPYF